MSQTLYRAFMMCSEEKKLGAMKKLGFSTDGKDFHGFLVWVKQENKGLDLMWLILDPLNPIDPRNIC